MANCESGCSGSCSGSCGGACSNSCTNLCSGCGGACSNSCTGCSGTCSGSCSGTCKNTCKGSCTGTCNTGCTNACVSACATTCNSACKGNCFQTCQDSCYQTCSGQCKGYCSEICQTYCETQQVFAKNVSPIANAVGKPTFSWTNEVKQNSTIKITADDWNKLKGYIKEAVKYCGGTSPSTGDVKKDDPITAATYNDLANGLAVPNVTAKETIITAEVIDKLRTVYNERKIDSSKPAGKYTGGQGECCQSKQICMASGELLAHQKKTEKCADQSTSSCGGQSPGS